MIALYNKYLLQGFFSNLLNFSQASHVDAHTDGHNDQYGDFTLENGDVVDGYEDVSWNDHDDFED